MTSSPSLTTAPLPLSGQSGIGWSIRRPSPRRPGDGRHDQLGNFQTALLGRITAASTRLFTCPADNRTKNGGRACPDPEIGRHHVTRGELVNISPNVTAAWLDWGAVVARDLGASPLAGPRRGVTGHTARDARIPPSH